SRHAAGTAGPHPVEGHAAGRRAAGWSPPPLVELRVQLEGTDRAGQAGLARGPLRQHRGRPGIHPPAPALNRTGGRLIAIATGTPCTRLIRLRCCDATARLQAWSLHALPAA